MKKILIMGLAALMLFTGCRSRESVSVEKVTQQERPIMDEPGDGPWELPVLIAVPEELREFVELYAEGYSKTELAKLDESLLLEVRFETLEIDTLVEDMDKGLNENGYFYDIYFCYEEQLPEIEALGGCRYSVYTEYMDKTGRNLYIGLLPQESLGKQEVKMDIVNYFKERMEEDFGSHFPEDLPIEE